MLSPLFSTTSNFILVATLLFASVEAIPLPGIPEVAERNLETRAVNVVSATDISGFTPFTQFARAAYCQPSKIKNWSCGRELGSFHFDRDRCLDDWVPTKPLASLQKPVVLLPVSNRP